MTGPHGPARQPLLRFLFQRPQALLVPLAEEACEAHEDRDQAHARATHDPTVERVEQRVAGDRANVGRSTFYAHYQDKEDLMTSGLVQLMQIMSGLVATPSRTGETRLFPTQELYEHVQEHHNLFKGMVRGRGLELFFEKGQEYWSQKALPWRHTFPEHQ